MAAARRLVLGRPSGAGAVLRRVLPDGRNPARLVVFGFGTAVLIGTGLLMLPIATESGVGTGWVASVFTATSAVSVTGLYVVDTPTHWSTFGELVILALIQIGGLGIMTVASLLGVTLARRLKLRTQRGVQTETKSFALGEVRSVVVRVITLSLLIESVTACVLAARFALGYGDSLGRAVYLGVFHAISAFNNAGFALYSDSLERFATDPWICLPILVALVLGGLGFPVLIEIGTRLRRSRTRWSLHARITLITYGALAAFGVITVTAIEWNNPATLGQFHVGGKLLAGLFQGLSPRTAGFNTVDIGELNSATLLIMNVLMFIGGGSAGTAGGIKVTTFALLAIVIFTEARGEAHVHAAGRKIPVTAHRQALTVALSGVGMVFLATLMLLWITPFTLDSVLFETVSAFGTVGLSTGITPNLPPVGQLVLVVLMFTGRVGPVTLAAALALRERARRYDRPEERPIIG